MLFLAMAWRNVWRHRRRSFLTIATIALGLTFNVFMRGVGDGFHEQMVDNSVQAHIGHIEIHKAGYHDDPGLNDTLPSPEAVRKAVSGLPHLRGVSMRVLGDGLASTAKNSAGVAIVGVDPEEEQTVTTIHNAVIEGQYLSNDQNSPVLIGERLAKVLQAELGESLVLLVQAADGSMGAEKYRITGIFRSGSPELDKGMVYLLRSDAQYLFSLDSRITEAALLLDSSQDVDEYTSTLTKELSADVEVLPWYVVEPYIQQFIDLDDAFFYVIVLILFIVISVGILNTILMSVFERVREFGVMMSLGMKPRQVVKLVMEEAALLGLVGVAIGGLLGSALTLYYASAGMDFGAWAQGAAALGMTTTEAFPKLTAANLVLSAVSVLAVVMLVSLYPAVRASRLRPVDAVRHV